MYLLFIFFIALHEIIPSSDINIVLASHCSKTCLVCVSSQEKVNGNAQEKDISIFYQVNFFSSLVMVPFKFILLSLWSIDKIFNAYSCIKIKFII